MDPLIDSLAPERFRNYLRMLAELQLGRAADAGIEPSDIVQQTMLDAHRDRAQFRGRTEAEMAAWLRRLLSCNLVDAAKARGRAKRDGDRERSLQAAIDASSARLESWLAAEQSSPSGLQRTRRAAPDRSATPQITAAGSAAVPAALWEPSPNILCSGN